MQPLDSSAPDANSIAMENELLKHEVRHLRARIAGLRVDLAHARDELREVPDYKSSHEDLVWLVERLDQTAFSGLLRRREGFRILLDRYAGQGKG